MTEKIERPTVVHGVTPRARLQCGNLYVAINRHKGKLFEVFAWMGGSGGCTSSQMNALTVSITMGIRHQVPPEVYIEKLKGIRCPVVSWDDGVKYLSCADAIAQLMEAELKKINEGVYEQEDKQ